ncbi:hypothetical protein MMYC01_204606 [Madurella mycetomatis]|uniref:SnoaL-like domain-containing protein n=1 Tax=Madurella mycetomatis TaxID=100816 RepID=A0A175VQL4_9PEZI|nr:hypothetical protein MMYC01_210171 [Madurella mycetomatis]KXX80426.1 hypothetical protein MMYC01_204606 [Madurella mycetomatis]
MAPTAAQIEALLQQKPLHSHIKSGNSGSMLHLGGLEDILADDVTLEIPGLGVEVQGRDKLTSADVHHKIPPMTNVINADHPVETLPPHVIGGGSDEWAVAILTSKAMTHSGKAWDHQTVALMHFNADDKIDLLRGYIDTKHVHEHIEAHGL